MKRRWLAVLALELIGFAVVILYLALNGVLP